MKLNQSQLQALDFLLFRINTLPNKTNDFTNLQAVIKIDGILWTGKFLEKINSSSVVQNSVDFIGDIDRELFSYKQENSSIKAIDQLVPMFFENQGLVSFAKHKDDLLLLYKELTKLLTNVTEKNSLPNFLYNAKQLSPNPNLALDYMDLSSYEELELIAILDYPSSKN
ncbi:hypothetical protein EP56_18120 [Listeriaceae bacterium FSL A5-0209]|nr:hypothetical protein EP56_18120 [Listeriaceae bacterium FSL A5-0209]